jgi:shikimate-5-dehydrogenase
MSASQLQPQTQIQPKKFFIFGQGISFSMSPIIHTAAFNFHSLPHTYTIHQTPTITPLAPLILSPTFGGASVTMPHKLNISTYCSSVSEHVKAIGALNTLVVEENGRGIRGENTDWSGLVSILRAKGEGIVERAKTGLVIGAGGASRAALYALYKLGIRDIYLVNRTRSTAEKIAEGFSALFKIRVFSNLEEISGLEEKQRPEIIIGTIPADKTTTEYFPRGLFGNESKKGICVDMAYKPRDTPLLKVAATTEGWRTVTGVEVLLEQAFEQSELWLGLPAPKEVMVRELEAHDRRKAEESRASGKL